MKNNTLQRSWMVIWLAAIVTLVAFHAGFYNFDSHKYLDVARNMMNTHQYILPYFQGHPYPDKGPLMFWLFIAGWKVFGIDLWWPQLLMFIFATGSIAVSMCMARLLWKDKPQIAMLVPIVLIGLPNWFGLTTQVRVDVPLMFFALLGMLALILCAQKGKKYWWLYAISIGLAAMCKGPVVLLFTLIPGLFFPVLKLQDKEQHSIVSWYAYLVSATLLGVAIALAWAIPAAIIGGHAYTDAIFYKQVSQRAGQSYSYFYYLWHLSYLLLPWGLYRPVYSGFNKNNDFYGFKVCSLIIVVSLVVFSFYGQKRIHYINPDFPLFAMLMAAGIGTYIAEARPVKRMHQWIVSAVFLIIAGVVVALPHFMHLVNVRSQVQFSYVLSVKYWVIAALVLLAGFYALYKPKSVPQQVVLIAIPFAVMSVAMIVLNQVAAVL